MKDRYISDFPRFENQAAFDSFYIALQKQLRSSRNGSGYLALTLGDHTGLIDARMWEKLEDAGPFEKGDVVKVRAQVCRFDERLQLKIEKIRAAQPGEYDIGDLLPRATRNIDEMWTELENDIAGFTNPHLKALAQAILTDEAIASALREAPAAKTMHHAYIGGLLEHVVSLFGLAQRVAEHYPEINRDLLLAGVLLHDIGKLHELEWKTGFDYTLEGQLLGHIQIGMVLVERKIDAIPGFPPRLRTLVLHMILSHHGKLEFGSPKLPMIPEAVMLHYLDDLDAKLETMRGEFARNRAAGRDPAAFTDRIWALDRAILDSAAYLSEGETDPPEGSR